MTRFFFIGAGAQTSAVLGLGAAAVKRKWFDEAVQCVSLCKKHKYGKHTTCEHGCSLGGCRGGKFLCIRGIY